MDTAAVMRNLDLVVTTDTAIPHLAGALGVPVWVALGYFADWRWFLDREDSPWYPTMRLFRQSSDGDWIGVFDRMAAALSEVATQRVREDSSSITTHDTPPLLVEISAGELIDKLTILEIKRDRIRDPNKLRNHRSRPTPTDGTTRPSGRPWVLRRIATPIALLWACHPSGAFHHIGPTAGSPEARICVTIHGRASPATRSSKERDHE